LLGTHTPAYYADLLYLIWASAMKGQEFYKMAPGGLASVNPYAVPSMVTLKGFIWTSSVRVGVWAPLAMFNFKVASGQRIYSNFKLFSEYEIIICHHLEPTTIKLFTVVIHS